MINMGQVSRFCNDGLLCHSPVIDRVQTLYVSDREGNKHVYGFDLRIT